MQILLAHPNGTFRLVWDLTTLVLLAFIGIFTPYQISFLSEIHNLDNIMEKWLGIFVVDRYVRACVRAFVCAYVRMCVRVCACVRVCVCVIGMWLRTLACPNAPYPNPLLRLIEAFFLIDIFVNFRTPWITETGHVVFNQRTACSRYINGWFMLDVISIIPFDLLFVLLEDGNTDSPSEFAR